MKTLDIAFKDLKHIFKSVFSLVMMFGAPLLIAGLLHFAFGGLGSEKSGFNMPVTVVEVVNLDHEGSPSGFAAGNTLVKFLQDPSLAGVISVRVASDEASARQSVDEQRTGVAVIIPPDFSEAATTPGRTTSVVIYQDPTLTIGPSIVKDLVSHFMDAFSGAKIAGHVASAGIIDLAVQNTVIQQYTAWIQSNGHGEGDATPRLAIISPAGVAQTKNQGGPQIGQVMAGMLVFFVFFMGANGAETIIKEDELGTLARLFNTPTQLTAIFSGKFLGIIVSLSIQVAILLLVSSFLFGIDWGRPAVIILATMGLVVASAGFGVLLMSFVKNSRQTGPVMGGVMVLMGMLGGVLTTGIPEMPAVFDRVTLITPQGWALHSWKVALSGAGAGPVVLPVVVLLVMGLAFLAIGVTRFQRRFA